MVNKSEITLICPRNDGEAVTIVEIAQRLDIDVRISAQPWGAKLRKEPQENLLNLKKVVVVVEMPSPEVEEALRQKGHEVIVIDHHCYNDGEDNIDRSSASSSLEQVAALVECELSREEMAVAINDRAYIYGLLDAGYIMDEILVVREKDIRIGQGATEQDFELCRRALEQGVMCGEVMIVVSETAQVSYIGDLYALEDPHTVRDLLICSPQDIRFFGSPEKAKALTRLGGWFGGGTRSKFWGSDKCSKEDVFEILGIN